tara:strand:- start:944 stop:1552 length:609 start_codon:yes stop_codon:yes gene_type:complete
MEKQESKQEFMDIEDKLSLIQTELKVKKTSFNKFGNYYYRSAESILEALKPLNIKYGVYFTINEALVNANPPIINSVATIWDCETGKSIDCTSVVGVDLEQKGMAMPQRYGSTSSYGKKYALGNLLLIDDTADDDATNKHIKEVKKPVIKEVKKPVAKIVLEKGTDNYKNVEAYLKTENADASLLLIKYEISDELKQNLNIK